MPDSVYVYIDGESHFIRSEKTWAATHTSPLAKATPIKGTVDDVLFHHKAKVFWSRFFAPGASRTYYFSSLVGDEKQYHEVCCMLRDFCLEPQIYKEDSSLSSQRARCFEQDGLIEKAKQVDCGLIVQVMKDAYEKKFDECMIFTSDVDILPAARAVHDMGCRVSVHGYGAGLSRFSAFRHQVDKFYDLTAELLNEYAPSE